MKSKLYQNISLISIYYFLPTHFLFFQAVSFFHVRVNFPCSKCRTPCPSHSFRFFTYDHPKYLNCTSSNVTVYCMLHPSVSHPLPIFYLFHPRNWPCLNDVIQYAFNIKFEVLELLKCLSTDTDNYDASDVENKTKYKVLSTDKYIAIIFVSATN
jgi:hypothetical protein